MGDTPGAGKPTEKPAEAPTKADPSPAQTLKAAGVELLPQAGDLVKAVDPWGVRELMERPGRLLWINFLAGVIRGIGFTLGVTVVGGLFLSWTISFLKPIVQVPVLGKYVGEVVKAVQDYTEPAKRK